MHTDLLLDKIRHNIYRLACVLCSASYVQAEALYGGHTPRRCPGGPPGAISPGYCHHHGQAGYMYKLIQSREKLYCIFDIKRRDKLPHEAHWAWHLYGVALREQTCNQWRKSENMFPSILKQSRSSKDVLLETGIYSLFHISGWLFLVNTYEPWVVVNSASPQ